MANENVDRLIAELSAILEKNRQARQTQDAMMTGAKQAQEQQSRAQALQRSYDDTGYIKHDNKSVRDPDGADGLGTKSQNYRANARGTEEFNQAFNDDQFAQAKSSSYGGDKAYGFGDTRPEVTGRGHSSADRVKLAQQYAFLQDNDTAAPAMNPTEAAILEERKKRMTQSLMAGRGQTGGPLGGAGQPAPAPSPETAALEKAGNPDLGNFGNITRDTFAGGTGGAPPPAGPTAAAPGDDYALLEALSQRYMSPEEIARR